MTTEVFARRDVAVVRAFNRPWTRQMGLLDAGLVDTPYSPPRRGCSSSWPRARAPTWPTSVGAWSWIRAT